MHTNNTMSIESMFTGAKTPEYAVFYNIAYWWMSDFLRPLYNSAGITLHERGEDYSKYINDFRKTSSVNKLPDSAYLKLRDYIWKGYLFDKNSSVLEVNEREKRLIHRCINKLSQLRNFHSHVWHDNSALTFDKNLKKWIDHLHEYAMQQLAKENQSAVDAYRADRKKYSLFDEHDEKFYISQDGRNFFLSLFLKKGEMSRFMQQRKGCKRNDKPEFKIKQDIYQFYAHRDGATKNRYNVANSAFLDLDKNTQGEILQAQQLYKMVSYLRDIPQEMTDTSLFPFLNQEKEIKTAEQMLAFIEEHHFLPRCAFGIVTNKEGKVFDKILTFEYENSNYRFEIRIKELHKLLLGILRNPGRETDFYKTLNTFSQYRVDFPDKLEAFIKGEISDLEILEFYNFKLKCNNFTREKLWKIIDCVNNKKPINYNTKNRLLELLITSPIELTYHNTFLEQDSKPRKENQFLRFAANYLMDMDLLPHWEWQMEKFEPEETIDKTDSHKHAIKKSKCFASKVPHGYRLSLKNNLLVVRHKEHPDQLFGWGENAMRNLILTHLQGRANKDLLNMLCNDIKRVKQAAVTKTPLAYEELSILGRKTMPHYLKMMMQDEEVICSETIGHASLKAKDRIQRLVDYFKDIQTGKVVLTRKEINTQLIRCYKFFDWKYEHQSEYKFLRKNEYQLMSIYHFTLAKPNHKPDFLRRLRQRLFCNYQQDVNIFRHLPANLHNLLESHTTLDGLFKAVLQESITLLKGWSQQLTSMHPNEKKACLSKLSIKVPLVPVPDQSIKQNLKQMPHLPLLIHPSIVLKAFGYKNESNIFAYFRDDKKNSKGLLEENYRYENYLGEFFCENPKWQKIKHKIVGKLNNIRTEDTLIWKMAQVYLDSDSQYMQALSTLLLNETDNTFRLNQINNSSIPVFQSDANIEKPYKVWVKFKQLNDYMLLTGEHLRKLATQIFRRYSNNEELQHAGVDIQNGTYQIPYTLLKQEMEKIYHESLMVTNCLLQWESDVVQHIPEREKDGIIQQARENKQSAQIKFWQVCKYAGLSEEEKLKLSMLRHHAMRANIPEDFSYREMIKDDRIKKILRIKEETLKKYDKKSAHYEALPH